MRERNVSAERGAVKNGAIPARACSWPTLGHMPSDTLRAIAERYGVTERANHDALDDSRVVARLLPHLFSAAGIERSDQLDRFAP